MAKKRATSSRGSRGKTPPPTLASLRRQIDRLDREVLERINARASLALEVGKLKEDAGQSFYAPAREDEVLERVLKRSKGPLPDACVRNVFRELVSGCRGLETPLRVAYLGPEHSFSHLAAVHRFGQSVELTPVANIRAVFEEVESGHAQFGLVPVENSTDGRVVDTLDMLARSPARICGEVPLPIHHNLLARCPRSKVRHVYSKPQALSQCRKWIAAHLPQAQVVEVASTSEAARLAAEEAGAAAVASLPAGVSRGLDILARDIEDNPDNLTRFAVIGSQAAERTGDDKTSLMFEVPHQPGALADAMAIFKRNKLNLSWIESFPVPRQTGRYLFFVELQGHQRDLRVRRAIASLEKKAVRLEILGSYPRMETVE